jgi:hypothetical protein
MKNATIGDPDLSTPQLDVRRTLKRSLLPALLCLALVAGPNLAQARGGGIGGFHGGGLGGFHSGGSVGIHTGGMGGFHPGGSAGFHSDPIGTIHGGGFSGTAVHSEAPLSGETDAMHATGPRSETDAGVTVLRGDTRAGQSRVGGRDGRHSAWLGYGPYLSSDDGIYDGYQNSGEPDASQYSYYCPNPPGYYPFVMQCSSAWEAVSGN